MALRVRSTLVNSPTVTRCTFRFLISINYFVDSSRSAQQYCAEFVWQKPCAPGQGLKMPKKAAATPATTPGLKKSSSSGGQKSLLGFFQKTPSTSSPAAQNTWSAPAAATPAPSKSRSKPASATSASTLTPVPSSDVLEPEDEGDYDAKASSPLPKGLPSPVSADGGQTNGVGELTSRGTPSRRVWFQSHPSHFG